MHRPVPQVRKFIVAAVLLLLSCDPMRAIRMMSGDDFLDPFVAATGRATPYPARTAEQLMSSGCDNMGCFNVWQGYCQSSSEVVARDAATCDLVGCPDVVLRAAQVQLDCANVPPRLLRFGIQPQLELIGLAKRTHETVKVRLQGLADQATSCQSARTLPLRCSSPTAQLGYDEYRSRLEQLLARERRVLDAYFKPVVAALQADLELGARLAAERAQACAAPMQLTMPPEEFFRSAQCSEATLPTAQFQALDASYRAAWQKKLLADACSNALTAARSVVLTAVAGRAEEAEALRAWADAAGKCGALWTEEWRKEAALAEAAIAARALARAAQLCTEQLSRATTAAASGNEAEAVSGLGAAGETCGQVADGAVRLEQAGRQVASALVEFAARLKKQALTGGALDAAAAALRSKLTTAAASNDPSLADDAWATQKAKQLLGAIGAVGAPRLSVVDAQDAPSGKVFVIQAAFSPGISYCVVFRRNRSDGTMAKDPRYGILNCRTPSDIDKAKSWNAGLYR